jgi:hypothetical protein
VPAGLDVWRPAIEDHRDVLAGGGGVAVQLLDEPADRPVRVVPPAVRPDADQVHAVNQPASLGARPAGTSLRVTRVRSH